MENQPNNLIPETDEILTFLGLDQLPDEQKQQVLEGLMSHFAEIAIETMSDSLTDEQASVLEKVLSKQPDKAQEKIRELSSRIPGLYDKIQFAIKQELEILKESYSQIK